MRELLGRSVKSDPPLVQHQDGVIQFQVRERVSHRQDDAAILPGKVVQEPHDFPLRARVEAGCHLVAEQQLGIGNQLHRQSEAALLATGKHLHLAIADRAQPGFLEHTVDPLVQLLGAPATDAQAGGRLHRFIHRQWLVGDGELRHVADFRRREIPLF